MIDIHIKAGRDPSALAQMIASTQGDDVKDPAVEQVATLVRQHQADVEMNRPSKHDMQTVDFKKIDDETDWSDV